MFVMNGIEVLYVLCRYECLVFVVVVIVVSCKGLKVLFLEEGFIDVIGKFIEWSVFIYVLECFLVKVEGFFVLNVVIVK